MAPNESLGTAVLTLKTDATQFNAGLDQAERRSTGLRQSFSDIAKGLVGLGKDGKVSLDSLSAAFQNPTAGAKALALEVGDGVVGSLGMATVAAVATVGAVVAVGVALVGLAMNAAASGAALQDASEITGVSVERLSGLKFAAEVSGDSLENVTNIIFRMQQRMAENPDQFEKGLSRIGVSIKDLADLEPDEQFIAIAKAFREAGPEVDRVATSVELFGKQGRDIIPLMTKDLKGLVDRSRELGMTWSTEDAEAAEKLEMKTRELHQIWSNLWIGIGNFFIPALHSVVTTATDVIGSIHGMYESVRLLWGEVRNVPTPKEIRQKLLPSGPTPPVSLDQAEKIGKEQDEQLRKQIAERERAAKALEAAQKRFEESIKRWRSPALGAPEVGLTRTFTEFGEVVDGTIIGVTDLTRQLSSAGIKTDEFGNLITVNLLPSLKNAGFELEHTKAKARGLGDVLTDIPSLIMQSFTGGGGLKGAVKAIGSDLGSTLMGNIFGKPGGETGLLKSMTGWMGDLFGKAIPIIGSLIGPAIDGLIKLFGDHAGKDVKRMGRQMGQDWSQGLVDQIKQDIHKYGGELQAVLMNLDKEIAEAGGVMAFGFERATQKAHDLFSMIEQGKLTVQQAGRTFNTVFGELADALGPDGEATQGMLALIDLDRQFGTGSATVAKYVIDNAKSGVQGLAAYLQTGATAYHNLEDAQTHLADLQKQYAAATGADRERIAKDIATVTAKIQTQKDLIAATAVTTADAAQAMAGGLLGAFGELSERIGITEAVKAVGPAVDALALQLQKAGLDGGAAFEDLRAIIGLAKDEVAGPALDGVSQLNQAFLGLHNSGLLNEEMFAGLASQVTKTRAALIAQGKDGGQVLRLMQPTLQTMWELQQDFGYAVDESTQAMLNEAEAAGLVGDKHRSAQERSALAAERTNTILEAMAKFFGVIIPAQAESGAKRVQTALDGIEPPDLTVHVNYDTSGLPDSPDAGGQTSPPAEPSARGSFVGRRQLQYLVAGGLAGMLAAIGFMPKGPDVVPAMLTPGEGIVSTLGMDRLGIDGLRAINQGESLSRIAGMDTSRLEAQLAGVQQELREHTAELGAIRDTIAATRVTSVQISGREVGLAIDTAADNNEGGLRTRFRETLGVG